MKVLRVAVCPQGFAIILFYLVVGRSLYRFSFWNDKFFAFAYTFVYCASLSQPHGCG